jgi:hypothetical protein
MIPEPPVRLILSQDGAQLKCLAVPASVLNAGWL